MAILAGVGCGVYASVEEACEKLISEDKCSHPEADHMETYRKYHQLYKKLYLDLKDSYKTLAAL